MSLLRRMGIWVSVIGVVGLVGLAGPSPAEAKLLELQLRVHGGGLAGIYGTEEYDPSNTDPDLAAVAGEDFFKARSGGCFGGTLNVEVLFIDFTYEFYQLVDNNGLNSTLNNFLVGFDWDFRAGRKWVITPYLLAGFGLATQNNSWLAKEYPQIALADLESRMVMTRIGIRFEYMVGKFFRLGFDIGGGYHYGMTTASAANDLDGHSHGFHVIGNISLAFVWNVFAKEKKKQPPKVIIIAPVGASQAPAPAPAAAPGLRKAPTPAPTPAPAPGLRTTPKPPATPGTTAPPPSRPTEAPPRTKKRQDPTPPATR